MSYNGDGYGLGRPGTRENINNTAKEQARIAINAGLGALVLGGLWMVAVLLAGWKAVFFGGLLIAGGFALFSLRAAIQATSKEHRLSFVASFVISTGAIVAMVVMHDDLQAYWPVPEIETTVYPAVPEAYYEAVDGCVNENHYPVAGCVMTMTTGVLTADGDTLFVDGAPIAPFGFGAGSNEADVIFSVDGKPVNIPFTEQVIKTTKRARGGVALFAGFAIVGILIASGVDVAFVASGIAETLNKNAPPTYSQAPWSVGPLFWIDAIFNRSFKLALRAHALKEIGAVDREKEEITKTVSEVIIVNETTGEVTTLEKPNADIPAIGQTNGKNRKAIQLAEKFGTPEMLRKLATAMNNGKNFSRPTGMTFGGWRDDQWDMFRDELISRGLAEKVGARAYKLTPAGRVWMRAFGLK